MFPGQQHFHINNQKLGFTFKTENSGLTEIDIILSGGTIDIYWGDGSTDLGVVSGTHSTTYSDSSEKVIKIKGDVGNITSLDIQNSNVTECNLEDLTSLQTLILTGNTFTSIDLSAQTVLTTFECSNNTSLLSVVNPVSTVNWVTYRVDGCSALTSLDLTNLGSYFGGIFYAQNTTALATATFPTSSRAFTLFWLFSTGITACDLSMLTGLAGDCRLNSNTSCESFTLPVSSGVFSKLWIYGCNNVNFTSLDVSDLTGLGGAVDFFNCTYLTTIVWPDSSQATIEVLVYGCALTSLDLAGESGSDGMTGLSGDIRYYSMSTLQSVTWPSSSGTISRVWGYNCANASFTSLDFTNINLGGDVRIYGCTSLTTITYGSSSTNLTFLQVNGNTNISVSDISGLTNLTGCAISFQGCTGLVQITLPTTSGYADQFYAFGCGLTTILNLDNFEAEDIRLQNNGAGFPTDTVVDDVFSNWANYSGSPNLNISGTNPAATGTYQAATVCPPTAQQEKLHELVNDSCATGNTLFTVTAN